jgi:methylmalonyl-CoA mutase N-terminal domain/subunit
VADTADAFGGSYIIEYMTKEIEKKVWEYLDKIEELGGGLKAIEEGFQMNEIERSSYEYQIKIENKEHIIVGVNKFQMEENSPQNLLKIDDEIRNIQIRKIKRLKETRDNLKVNTLLDVIKAKAKSNDNLLPTILDAVETYATLGEISDALRNVWGEFKR